MTVTNSQSGTNVGEVADGIYRINTPVVLGGPGDFSFNQYLILDDEPLLFHTGLRRLFRSSDCGMWRSRTSRQMSAARSMTGWQQPPKQCQCAARSQRWCP